MLPRQNYIIAVLQACVTACTEVSQLVLQEPDPTPYRRASSLSHDCADLCELTVRFVARESEHLVYILRECAELCRSCADEQARHAAHLAVCARTEQACRLAEDACRTAYH
ncbi:four-helix bundle copper-binding protein [Hymenobacter sp. BT186]|uniref:Four-helix bundle copper-binding protein n=1 Tax=Hymenobacter telluris TaxID=2816474 RepID=A0A939EVU5_9BACT|nr:four-helix bundle copper-binding protein [Hymenobacter telluris]MBO0357966.1 four-helix bundle copper-binding protein [Hymenobacter telluris]MBW3373993.1 four-helix bundle copper-binding protein [Hymenobacter norwichensis]